MDVGVDESRHHKAAIERQGLRIGGDGRLDRGDASAADTDIDKPVALPCDARLAQYEI